MANSSDQANKIAFPAWEPEYQAAVRETNHLHVGEKIHAAEAAMSKRLKDLKDAPANSAERQAIAEALDALQKLQIKIFGYSDWHT